ncbi:MAG: dipeptide epimerase [Saprospiraceae bacterium]|nr:dipeptide epimerase [Saprospiraceae bacterium]
MKIVNVRCWKENLELTKPYTIAYTTVDAVENFFVAIELENGTVGLGAGSPSDFVTGEDLLESFAALNANLEPLLKGEDIRHFSLILRRIREVLAPYPAARAAIDIALYDAFTNLLGVPLVDYLGKAQEGLPTSITIGIKSLEATLEEAAEDVRLGFRIIKLKTGLEVEKDIEVFRKLRETVGPDVKIRVDANQGYSIPDLLRFVDGTRDAAVEFIEQPFKAGHQHWMLQLPEPVRQLCAADEDLHNPSDAMRMAVSPRPYGIYNIKLMKCGGVSESLHIAEAAQRFGISLMWGCMDESIISISAALHAALASPATRYLDLDGSFDLARDIVSGGFILRNGCLYANGKPGLGVVRL